MIALIANICLTCFSQVTRGGRALGQNQATCRCQDARQNQALGQGQSRTAGQDETARQSRAARWSRALDRLSLEPGEPRAYGGDDHGRQHVCRLEGTRPDEVDPYAEDEDRTHEGEVGERRIR